MSWSFFVLVGMDDAEALFTLYAHVSEWKTVLLKYQYGFLFQLGCGLCGRYSHSHHQNSADCLVCSLFGKVGSEYLRYVIPVLLFAILSKNYRLKTELHYNDNGISLRLLDDFTRQNIFLLPSAIFIYVASMKLIGIENL